MHNAVISDASCFIIFNKIGSLDLLQQTYGEITTTPQVVSEIKFQLPTWVIVQQPDLSKLPVDVPASIDSGEASAIALALGKLDSILIIDEKAARNYATRLGLHVTGTLGVIVKAKVDGVIPSIRPFVEKIRKTNFRFSSVIEAEAYALANEAAE